MTTLEIHHNDGSASHYPATLVDARRVLRARYGANAVIGEWDEQVGIDRKLVWADPDDCDDGQKAVAEIVRRS